MRVGRGLVVALLCALVVTLGRSAAGASGPCPEITTRAAEAGTVLVGTTTAVADGSVTLRVTDVFKGAPGSVVRLTSSDPAWQVSRQYVVFAAGTGPRLAPDACGTPVPVADDVLAAVAGALGPGTPLGRGSDPGAVPSPSSAAPTTAADADGSARAAGESSGASREGKGTTTSRILLGIVLGVAVLGSFLLPQLRRHNRERRRRRREGVDTEPDDPDLAPGWRDR